MPRNQRNIVAESCSLPMNKRQGKVWGAAKRHSNDTFISMRDETDTSRSRVGKRSYEKAEQVASCKSRKKAAQELVVEVVKWKSVAQVCLRSVLQLLKFPKRVTVRMWEVKRKPIWSIMPRVKPRDSTKKVTGVVPSSGMPTASGFLIQFLTDDGWKAVLKDEFQKEYFCLLDTQLAKE